MDTMQVNKVAAAILVSGIVFFTAGRIGVILVQAPVPSKPVITLGLEPAKPAGTAAPAPAQPFEALLASATVEAGAAAFKGAGCIACHSVNEGGKAGVGPNLWGVLGAPEGGREGFAYSDALKGKGGKWTYESLNAWLTKPAAFAPGTKMTFAGVPEDKKRADIIVYLRSLSATPAPLPAVPATAAAPAAAAAAPAGGGGEESFSKLLASADADAGKANTMKLGCVACHSFNEGGKNGLGPNLWGVVGAHMAAHDGYTYSAALKGKDGSWTFDNLNAWLTKPAGFAAGTKMTYAGVADAKTRADVIAYLRTLSANPVPLP